jgi:hypothetical protein
VVWGGAVSPLFPRSGSAEAEEGRRRGVGVVGGLTDQLDDITAVAIHNH